MDRGLYVADPVLSVRQLSVDFTTDDGQLHAVDDVSFDLARGETLGIVGESGSGKTVTSLALLGLLPKTAAIRGEARFDGANLLALDEKRLQPVRGNRIAMIFQGALTALNPCTGSAIRHAAIAVLRSPAGAELHERAVALLELVGIPQPNHAGNTAPVLGRDAAAGDDPDGHEQPDVLSPTSRRRARDDQAQVLVLERIQTGRHAIILITHDLGVVGASPTALLVMCRPRGRIGSVDDIFYWPVTRTPAGCSARGRASTGASRVNACSRSAGSRPR
jgi:ABC-type glutathione transport system ATPase component